MPTSDATAATATNTACTSPLTVSSLEAAAAAGTAAAGRADNDPPGSGGGGGGGGVGGGGVPQVVSGVVDDPDHPASAREAASSAMAMLRLRDDDEYESSHPYPSSSSAAAAAAATAEEKFKMRHQRTPPTEFDRRKLFVGGLPTDVTDDGFFEFFNSFGPVVDSVVMVDRMTRRSRGFGFVTFANENDAINILTAIPGKTGYVFINRKQCEVKASTPKTADGLVVKHQRPHHHGGGAGQWSSNPPHHHHRDNNHRGYNPHRTTLGGGAVPPPGPARQQQQQRDAPRDAGGAKQTRAGGEFDASTTTASIGNYDYARQPPSSQVMAPAMSAYHGRGSAVYQPRYPIAYPAAASSVYVYPGGDGAGPAAAPAVVVQSPYDSPYPAMSQGPGGSDGGYYNPYPYAQYAGQQYHGIQQIVPPPPDDGGTSHGVRNLQRLRCRRRRVGAGSDGPAFAGGV
jgi:RNA recognition motif-containing protein